MGTLISLITLVAGFGISAVFAERWLEAVIGTGAEVARSDELTDEEKTRAYIFSFGLEHANYTSPTDSIKTTKQQDLTP